MIISYNHRNFFIPIKIGNKYKIEYQSSERQSVFELIMQLLTMHYFEDCNFLFKGNFNLQHVNYNRKD